ARARARGHQRPPQHGARVRRVSSPLGQSLPAARLGGPAVGIDPRDLRYRVSGAGAGAAQEQAGSRDPGARRGRLGLQEHDLRVQPAGRALVAPGYFGVSVPRRPWASPSGPAVKNSAVESALGPNVSPQRPSITIGFPVPSRRKSMKPPLVGSYAPIRPSPKLPSSRSRLNPPNPAGASATPHGEFKLPRVANRLARVPSGLKTST